MAPASSARADPATSSASAPAPAVGSAEQCGAVGVLADDFFRLAHHHVTGKPREGMTHRVLSMGLAAALFGELIAEYLITLDDDDHILLTGDRVPDDPIHLAMLWDLRREHLLPVRDWLTYVAVTAYDRVGDRLRKAGQVSRPKRVGPLWSRQTVYAPLDMNVASLPEASVHMKLMNVATGYSEVPPPIRLHFTYNDTCLAGLALATGLDRMLLDGTPPEAKTYLIWAVSSLHPPMLRLVQHTQAAVGDLVLAHRT